MLAVVAAIVWSLLPVLCPSEWSAAAAHAYSVADAGDSHADGAPHDHPAHDDESNACCNAVASAKFMAPAACAAPSVKVVLVLPTVAPVALVVGGYRMPGSGLVRDATGPPPTTRGRYVTYSPLAPPIDAA